MSRGPRTVESTTTTEVPEFLQQPLRQATSAVMNQFNQGGGINPFNSLDMQFNRAADLTRNRLTSEFAGYGRNLDASYPARSDELQTLAANIYSPQNLLAFDPTNMMIDRLAAIIPGAGGVTTSRQPYFRQGLFG